MYKTPSLTTPASSNGSLQSTFTIHLLDAENTESGCCFLVPKSWKKKKEIKMMCLTITPLIVLLILLLWQSVEKVFEINNSNKLGTKLEISVDIGHLIDKLQKEREMCVFYRRRLPLAIKSKLPKIFTDTDNAIEKLKNWPSNLREKSWVFGTKETFRKYIGRHRTALTLWKVTESDDVASNKEIAFYTSILDVFVDYFKRSLEESNYGRRWRALVAYETIIKAKEHLGIATTLGLLFFANGKFQSLNDYLRFAQQANEAESLLIQAKNFSPLVTAVDSQRNITSRQEQSVKQYKNLILSRSLTIDKPTNFSIQMLVTYSEDMDGYSDKVRRIQEDLENHIMAEVIRGTTNGIIGLGLTIVLLVFVVIVTPLICFRILDMTHQIQQCVVSLADKTRELRTEKRRTETLLYQMLPRPVAKQLKRKVGVDAEFFEEATIFFSRITDFHEISARCSPIKIVELLNTLYVEFDKKIEMFDVYKVETIGDCYMVASGLPIRNEDKHCKDIALMALALMSLTFGIEPMDIGIDSRIDYINVRMGIHTGPCVAGVVGTTLPRYCVFGDTVNTAARLESSSLANKIHISSRIHQMLSKVGGFKMKARGVMELKGKGIMSTYWLENHTGSRHLSSSTSLDSKEEYIGDFVGSQFEQIHSPQETCIETGDPFESEMSSTNSGPTSTRQQRHAIVADSGQAETMTPVSE
ncbi:unnamed protein product [Owenia fusiformis]|uniref:guanylate cyclase n=1 Tax=Owenia fusiformis TaxID=6347 RepID=A0A8J1TRA6_OWEFU|nr:unnamed protein product [Owenia fusiformis]